MIRKLSIFFFVLLSVATYAANMTFYGPGNFSTASLWTGSALPNAGDNLTISRGACTVTASDSNVYGSLTIQSGITFNQQTYDISCGAYSCAGLDIRGVSTNSGLTCSGFYMAATSSAKWSTGSKITNSGNCNIPAGIISAGNYLTY